MTDEAKEALDRLMASGEVELDPRSYKAVMELLGHPTADPHHDHVKRLGTRAERTATNIEAWRIYNEQRAEDARQRREARREAKSRPGTLPGPPKSKTTQGKGKP